MSHMVMDQINYNWTSTQKITTEGSPVEHGKWIHGERKTPIQGNYFRPCTVQYQGTHRGKKPIQPQTFLDAE